MWSNTMSFLMKASFFLKRREVIWFFRLYFLLNFILFYRVQPSNKTTTKIIITPSHPSVHQQKYQQQQRFFRILSLSLKMLFLSYPAIQVFRWRRIHATLTWAGKIVWNNQQKKKRQKGTKKAFFFQLTFYHHYLIHIWKAY